MVDLLIGMAFVALLAIPVLVASRLSSESLR
jgi:hypothetical protein